MDPYIGEMRWIAFSSVPNGWMACEGQILNVRDHQALFSLFGPRYGGDGVGTFALPKVQPLAGGLRCIIATAGTFPRRA